MSLFSHAGRELVYNVSSSEFDHDILLLQGVQFNAGIWRPVLADLESSTRTGRVITCEWHDPKRTMSEMAEDVLGLVQAIGLVEVQVIASEEAVDLVQLIEQLESGVFKEVSAFPAALPKGDEVLHAIAEFSQSGRGP